MQIFALQTNREKTKNALLSNGEELLFTVRYSRFIYVLGIIPQLFLTAVLIGIGVLFFLYEPLYAQWALLVLICVWTLFILLPIIYKYLHWFYSFVLITKERIVVVDQVSLVHRKETELSLENFAGVSSETQFWNIFPFGILHFTMREGNEQLAPLHYVTDVDKVAKEISDVVTSFQRLA